MASTTPHRQRPRNGGRGPFSPEDPSENSAGSAWSMDDKETTQTMTSEPRAVPVRRSASALSPGAGSAASHNPRNPGHRLYLRGTDRQMAKSFWAERERAKDSFRRDGFVECTFAPQLSENVHKMDRPKELAPENRFKQEEQRKRMRLEIARRKALEKEVEGCTFRPLTLRAASLSPYAPTRVGGVHEALYRIADAKKKWARQIQPEVLAQLLARRNAAVDPEAHGAPQMTPEEIEELIERMVHPAEYDERLAAEGDPAAARRVRSRSRSNSPEDAEGLRKPRISAVSAVLAEERIQREGEPADVVERLQHRPLAEPAQPDPQATHRPIIATATENIVATSRERHLRELFQELCFAARAMHQAGANGNPNVSSDSITAAPGPASGRPPLPRPSGAPDALARLTFKEITEAAHILLGPSDTNDLLTVLTRSTHNSFDSTTFVNVILRHAKRYGLKPFMRPNAGRGGSARDRAMQRLAMQDMARAAQKERAIGRTDKYASSRRADYVAPSERAAKQRESTKQRLEQLREYQAAEEVAECTFRPKLNLSQYVFVRTGSRPTSQSVPTPQAELAEVSAETPDRERRSPGTKPTGRRHVDPNAAGHSRDAAFDGVAADRHTHAMAPSRDTSLEGLGATARPGGRPRRSQSADDPTRVRARTVMRDDDVYRGSIAEEYALGGDDGLRGLGREMMREQLLRERATVHLADARAQRAGRSSSSH